MIDDYSPSYSYVSLSMPSFASLLTSPDWFIFTPTITVATGSYTISFDLSDGPYTSSYSFLVNVNPNQAPTFINPLTDQTIITGATLTYTLPALTDAESDPISLSPVSYPSFCTYAAR